MLHWTADSHEPAVAQEGHYLGARSKFQNTRTTRSLVLVMAERRRRRRMWKISDSTIGVLCPKSAQQDLPLGPPLTLVEIFQKYRKIIELEYISTLTHVFVKILLEKNMNTFKTRCQNEFTVKGQKKFKLLLFNFFMISMGFLLYWKVISRIFLQNNKPFPVIQDFGNVSWRNPLINWEYLKDFSVAKNPL